MNTEKEVCRALLGVVSVATGAISAVPAKATVHVEAPLCGCFPRLTRSRRVASFKFEEEVEGGPSSGSYLSRTAALDLQHLLHYSVSNVFSAEVKVCVLGRGQKLVVRTDLAHFMDELTGHGSAEGFVLKVRKGELALELLQQRQEPQLEEASELDQMTDGTANGHELNDSKNDDTHCDNDEHEAGNEAVEVHETDSEEYDDDKEWEAIKKDIEQYFNDTEWSPSEGKLEQNDGAEYSRGEKELEAYNDFAEWDHSEEELQPCVSDAELDTNGKEFEPFNAFAEQEHSDQGLEDTTSPSAPTSPDPPLLPLWNDFIIVAGAIRLVGEFV